MQRVGNVKTMKHIIVLEGKKGRRMALEGTIAQPFQEATDRSLSIFSQVAHDRDLPLTRISPPLYTPTILWEAVVRRWKHGHHGTVRTLCRRDNVG